MQIDSEQDCQDATSQYANQETFHRVRQQISDLRTYASVLGKIIENNIAQKNAASWTRTTT